MSDENEKSKSRLQRFLDKLFESSEDVVYDAVNVAKDTMKHQIHKPLDIVITVKSLEVMVNGILASLKSMNPNRYSGVKRFVDYTKNTLADFYFILEEAKPSNTVLDTVAQSIKNELDDTVTMIYKLSTLKPKRRSFRQRVTQEETDAFIQQKMNEFIPDIKNNLVAFLSDKQVILATTGSMIAANDKSGGDKSGP